MRRSALLNLLVCVEVECVDGVDECGRGVLMCELTCGVSSTHGVLMGVSLKLSCLGTGNGVSVERPGVGTPTECVVVDCVVVLGRLGVGMWEDGVVVYGSCGVGIFVDGVVV